MNPLILIIAIIVIPIGLVVGIFLAFKDQILSYLYPNMYAKITMLESDNNIIDFMVKKSKDLRFTFNDGYYNLFESLEVPKPYDGIKKGTSIYRSGRLVRFIFKEGNENPIDLRSIRATGNPQLNKQINAIDITRIVTGRGLDGMEIIRKYGLWIVIGIIVLFIVMGLMRGG